MWPYPYKLTHFFDTGMSSSEDTTVGSWSSLLTATNSSSLSDLMEPSSESKLYLVCLASEVEKLKSGNSEMGGWNRLVLQFRYWRWKKDTMINLISICNVYTVSHAISFSEDINHIITSCISIKYLNNSKFVLTFVLLIEMTKTEPILSFKYS